MRLLIALAMSAVLTGCGARASCCHKAAVYEPISGVCVGDADRCEVFKLESFLRLLNYAERTTSPASETERVCTQQAIEGGSAETSAVYADDSSCAPDPALYDKIKVDAQARLDVVQKRLLEK